MDTQGDRRVTFKYAGNAAIDSEVAEVLKRFDANGDGTVSASDLVAGASALQQLRSANHLLRRVVLMLFVVAVVVLLGSFGCTMWAIDLSKDTVVSGDVLVTSDGGAVRVNSGDVEVVDGKMRHRSASRQVEFFLYPGHEDTGKLLPSLVATGHFVPTVGVSFDEVNMLISRSDVLAALDHMARGRPGEFVVEETASNGKRRTLVHVTSVTSEETTGTTKLSGSVYSELFSGWLGRELWFSMECKKEDSDMCRAAVETVSTQEERARRMNDGGAALREYYEDRRLGNPRQLQEYSVNTRPDRLFNKYLPEDVRNSLNNK